MKATCAQVYGWIKFSSPILQRKSYSKHSKLTVQNICRQSNKENTLRPRSFQNEIKSFSRRKARKYKIPFFTKVKWPPRKGWLCNLAMAFVSQARKIGGGVFKIQENELAGFISKFITLRCLLFGFFLFLFCFAKEQDAQKEKYEEESNESQATDAPRRRPRYLNEPRWTKGKVGRLSKRSEHARYRLWVIVKISVLRDFVECLLV